MRPADGARAFAMPVAEDLLLEVPALDEARTALDEIKANAISGDADARTRAMQALLDLARRDPNSHQEAISIFKGALDHERSPWAAISAAQGIAHILGPAEGRRAWQQLLDHPRGEFATIAASLVDASMSDGLLKSLNERHEPQVRIAIMRALGRLKHAPALLPLAQQLSEPAMRPHAIEALADLGDPTALNHLKPLLRDKSNAWRADSQGPMLRVCDIAKVAIDRLTPPPQPVQPKSEPKPTVSSTVAKQGNPLLYAPIVAALLQLPWIGAVLFATFVTIGTLEAGNQYLKVLDLVSMAPAILGVALGSASLTQSFPRTIWQWLFFLVGMVLCGGAIYILGLELVQLPAA